MTRACSERRAATAEPTWPELPVTRMFINPASLPEGGRLRRQVKDQGAAYQIEAVTRVPR